MFNSLLFYIQFKAWIFETVFFMYHCFVLIAWWVPWARTKCVAIAHSLLLFVITPWSELCLCIVYGSLDREDGCRCDRNRLRNS